MKPLILFLGLTLMAVCALFVRYFLRAYFDKQYGRALIFKGFASLCFVTLGGLLFTVSDNILFAYKLGEKPRFLQNIALHVAYYLAQFAIAFSIALL